ncbi:hypothetical protein ACHAQA_009394 [Verticillium albo-atrum]
MSKDFREEETKWASHPDLLALPGFEFTPAADGTIVSKAFGPACRVFFGKDYENHVAAAGITGSVYIAQHTTVLLHHAVRCLRAQREQADGEIEAKESIHQQFFRQVVLNRLSSVEAVWDVRVASKRVGLVVRIFVEARVRFLGGFSEHSHDPDNNPAFEALYGAIDEWLGELKKGNLPFELYDKYIKMLEGIDEPTQIYGDHFKLACRSSEAGRAKGSEDTLDAKDAADYNTGGGGGIMDWQ